MFISLIIGCATVFVSMGIQIIAVVFMLQYLEGFISVEKEKFASLSSNTYILSMVMLMLFIGHLVQVAIWALLFIYLDEFGDFAIAFYHSMVNFASLGYGDIVMSEEWRLLGAIEASNGVLMFGLSAGTLLSVMTYLIRSSRQANIQLSETSDK